MFNKEYVTAMLLPFVGKTLRMRTDSEDKKFSIPFCLETSMESTFQIEFTNVGIKYLLKDNFYIKRDLAKCFSDSFHELEIYPFQLDNLLKEKPEGHEPVVLTAMIKYLQDNFNPQIAFTYYTMIKSLKVTKYGFVLNGIEFSICS